MEEREREKEERSMAPANVVHKALYDKIHKRIKGKLEKQGRRWSAYASGQLVQQYKREVKANKALHGTAYRGPKKRADSKGGGGLARWYEEKWIDVCALPKKVPCGRKGAKNLSYAQMKKKYPYCRPLKKVNSKTPKTASSLSERTRKAMCAQKRRAPKKAVRLSSKNGKQSSRGHR